jgi:DNA polymerase-3 subunit alpha
MLDGFGKPEQYVERLQEIGHKAIAITDHGNIFAHRAFEPVCKAAGIKFIPGVELYVRNTKTSERYFHITVLPRDNNGYANLCRLVSLGNQPSHFSKRPLLLLSEIREFSAGLVVLSGCFGDGIPHRAYLKNKESVLGKVLALKRMFRTIPFYLEVQHHDMEELAFMRCVADMAKVPVCPTVDAHYPRKADFRTQDMMVCIGTHERMANKNRFKMLDTLWLMDDTEMRRFFTDDELKTTDEIAEMCNVQLPTVQPVRLDGDREMLIEMVRQGAVRLGKDVKNETYRARYRYELSVIDKLGLHSYFVIMADCIRSFKASGMFIGPARGSSAGSIVAYLLGITEVDPIRYALSFERFLDVNRKDYPDIDTDFPHDQRERVIAYLRHKYGSDRVGRLCSFGTYKGSSTFWDLARIYSLDSSIARELGKAVPQFVNDDQDMESIMEMPEVQKICSKYPIFKYAKDLEGQVRQLGKHASGYAISPTPLGDMVAEYLSGGEPVLSVDKYTAEKMGLLKLDILGLTTLDMIQNIMKDVGLKNETLYRIEPISDQVFEQFRLRNVAGIFQFEGGAVRRALSAIPVASLDDLAFINAVARPGASLALEKDAFVPECLKQFCYKQKYFVYQEELMAILRFLDFDWADVTKFRKMVSRKLVTEMEATYHARFVEALSTHCGVQDAERFWQTVLRTGSYSFNKSHAVSYAMLAYVSMYLKITYPAQFVKHYLNMVKDDGKRRAIIREYMKGGWSIVIGGEKAQAGFETDGTAIIGGLCSLKGIGPAKAAKYAGGKTDRAIEKALVGAQTSPEIYAPWAAIENYSNRYPLGDLPEGEFMVTARVWNIKDNHCVMEDKNGAEKAYFDPRWVKLKEGEVYRLAVTKYRYARIDSAKKLHD